MKNIFSSISVYFSKKMSLLTNTRNKCVMRNINLFLASWKMAKLFASKVFHFQYDDRVLVYKWGTSERAGRYVCKNLWNLDCQDSIYLAFFKLLKNEESFRKSFSLPCSPTFFHRNFKCLFQKLSSFLSCLHFAIS